MISQTLLCSSATRRVGHHSMSWVPMGSHGMSHGLSRQWDMPWVPMNPCHAMACPKTCPDMPRYATISRVMPRLFQRLPRHAAAFPTVKRRSACHDISWTHRNMLRYARGNYQQRSLQRWALTRNSSTSRLTSSKYVYKIERNFPSRRTVATVYHVYHRIPPLYQPIQSLD